MKRWGKLVSVLLAASLLSGCSLREWFTLEGVDLTRLKLGNGKVEQLAPSPTPTAVPTEKPAPEGSAGQVLALMNALIDNDYTAVTGICPDGLPGYTTQNTQGSAQLQKLYGAVYQNLSVRFGTVSEWTNAANVVAEFTTLDGKAILADFKAAAEAWCAGEGSGADHETRMAAYRELLFAAADSAEKTVMRRVNVALRKESGHWVVEADNELRAALTGGLSIALQDFDLPGELPADAEQEGQGGTTYKPLVNNAYGAAYVSAVYPNDPAGYVMEITIDNVSDTALVYSMKNVLLNGCLIDPDWYETAAAHERKVSRVVWDRAKLAACGIPFVKNISFRFDSYEKPAWPVYPLSMNYCTVYPAGGGEARIGRPEEADRQVLSDDGVTFVSVLSAHSDGCWGYSMTLYLENNSNQELWFAFDDTRLDGQYADPGWSQTLPGGARAIETVCWPAGDLILLGIDDVQRSDFKLSISTLVGLDEQERSYSSGGRVTVSGDGIRLS